jgi:hypothetical protein
MTRATTNKNIQDFFKGYLPETRLYDNKKNSPPISRCEHYTKNLRMFNAYLKVAVSE